jgi:hypothetical protein
VERGKEKKEAVYFFQYNAMARDDIERSNTQKNIGT